MIKNLRAYPVFDSLGGGAIRIRVFTDKGSYSASVPVGDDLKRLLSIFSSIRPNFIGLDEGEWQSLESFLLELIPGEKTLSLSMSLAFARSASRGNLWELGRGRSFPLPLVNIISNRHMQEFFIIPYRARDPQEAAGTCLEVYNAALEELKVGKHLEGRSPDGSWFCRLDLMGALEFLNSLAGDWDLKIGADLSAQRLWNGRVYKPGPESLVPSEYMDFVEEISHTYRIYYLEDPFRAGDFKSFSGLAERLKNRLIVGNSFYRLDQERLNKGIGMKSGNGAVVTPSRAGTVSEVLNLSGLLRKGGFHPVISQNPGGETEDSYLSDLSILCNASLLKTGLSGSERLCKLNRLIELWHEVPDARMAGLP